MSAGNLHSAVLLSNGDVLAFGSNKCQQCDIPKLAAGESYIQVAAGGFHTLLLRSDGKPLAVGDNSAGQCNVPELSSDAKCISVIAGDFHSVLVLEAGGAIAFGRDNDGQCKIPETPAGMSYTRAAASARHTVLLRSDGNAVTSGSNQAGQCDVPSLPEGITYVDVAAGDWHTTLLRSDGVAVSVGRSFPVLDQCVDDDLVGDHPQDDADNDRSMSKISTAGKNSKANVFGRTGCCAVPRSGDNGSMLKRVAAGSQHTVFVFSAPSGLAEANGSDINGQCTVPELPPGMQYTFAAGGHQHTLLLRSDGQCVVVGDNSHGQSTVPQLPGGAQCIVSPADKLQSTVPELPSVAKGLSEPMAPCAAAPDGEKEDEAAQIDMNLSEQSKKQPETRSVISFSENEISEYKDDMKEGSPRADRCEGLLICCRSK